jgi:hypothetical protein
MKKNILALMLIWFSLQAKTEEDIEPIKEGNLSLPESQQLGPLFSFGQNIIGKDVLQVYSYFDYLKGHRQKSAEIIPAILYGITDSLSVFINFPVSIKNQVNGNKSSGIEDIYAQFEYAAYNKNHLTTIDQWTLVASLYLPTGSQFKNPPTGHGQPSIFLGTTLCHLAIDWYFFTSAGATLVAAKNNNKFGNQFLYQAGMGRNIGTLPGWIFTWILEFNGIYNQGNNVNGLIDLNSGGNLIFIGPSLWISSKKLILQAGISFPVYQHLFGIQNKNDYFAAFNFGYTF